MSAVLVHRSSFEFEWWGWCAVLRGFGTAWCPVRLGCVSNNPYDTCLTDTACHQLVMSVQCDYDYKLGCIVLASHKKKVVGNTAIDNYIDCVRLNWKYHPFLRDYLEYS